MNVVILGIFSKLTILLLGMMGLLFASARRLEKPRRVVVRRVIVPSPFGLPVRTETSRLVSLPSRAPPGVTTTIQRGSGRFGDR